MTMLVTLDEGKLHLRVTHDADDDDIILKIEAASEAVLDYLDDAGLVYVDSTGVMQVSHSELPRKLKQATLLLLGDFYCERESSQPKYEVGRDHDLQLAVVALLKPLRTPAIA